MKIDAVVTNPGEIEVAMTITMDLNRWKQLREQLATEYPAWDLSSKIREMVERVENRFYPEDES